jgi:predicted dehydrogenase
VADRAGTATPAAGGGSSATTAEPRRGVVGVGIVGAGVISGEYLENLGRFADTRIVAIGDLRPDAARGRASEHGIQAAGTTEDVLGNPDVEIVVNLTVPEAHASIAEQSLAAGKHVWNEKPLALDTTAGRRLLELAARNQLRLGCAPDTFLGEGLQAARRIVDDGTIGRPLTALALMQSPGPDAWHPNPAFLFQRGAGPLFDIGPYYLTGFVQLFGSVSAVAALSSTANETRRIGSGPRAGETFAVTAPTHIGALIAFVGGHSAQLIVSFDSPQPRILLEVTGTDATLILPDPNRFDGELSIRRRGTDAAETIARTTARSTRGTGVLDMARAIREGRPHRADGSLALHVLEVMEAIATAAESRTVVDVDSRVERPDPLPADWDPLVATLAR